MSANAADHGGDNPEIVVPGFTSRFLAAFAELLKVEGGFVDDPADRGGATNHGISLRFLKAEGAFDEDGDGIAEFDLDMDGDIDGADIRRLTAADARVLYFRCFWQRIEADRLPRPLGEMVFDQAVNGGLVAACKLLQRAINQCLIRASTSTTRPGLLASDGQLGGATFAAMNWVLRHPGLGMPALAKAYREAAEERYRSIVFRNPSQKRFINGWVSRARALGRWAE